MRELVEGHPVMKVSWDEMAQFCGGCDFFDKRTNGCREPNVDTTRRESFVLRGSCGYSSIDRVFGTMTPEGFKPSPLLITG